MKIGERFGRLCIVEATNTRTNNKIHYLCKCDCGNTIEVRGTSLTSGNTKSCGCLQKEECTKTALENIKTNGMTRLKHKKLNKNNTSGITGISFSKYHNKWQAQINHNKIIYKKRFKNYDDAVAWRLELEKEFIEQEE